MNFDAIHSPATKTKTCIIKVALPHINITNGKMIRNNIAPAIKLIIVIVGSILVIVVTPNVAAILFK